MPDKPLFSRKAKLASPYLIAAAGFIALASAAALYIWRLSPTKPDEKPEAKVAAPPAAASAPAPAASAAPIPITVICQPPAVTEAPAPRAKARRANTTNVQQNNNQHIHEEDSDIPYRMIFDPQPRVFNISQAQPLKRRYAAYQYNG